ncbi:uncharacterized protein LOC124496156 isoform X2 [Dermatophagoides farinae]|uniref:Ig-like domain-containing protein n=2 Tax=Dermatophagoides farinae TaxID=6954 RepID=A0A922I973_DERFA|nr:uncharacterized protein LOC124496156 isoform X2 [Dermatophagoides farinae]KAH9526685.1 hypothetical protein DERF_000750 [Dermatophagoides farinae]
MIKCDLFLIIMMMMARKTIMIWKKCQQQQQIRHMMAMISTIHLIIFSMNLIHSVQGLSDVRVVALNVPSQVRKGSEVELSCLYDLGGGNASLYSLKWFYRANDTDLDEQEFFRYTPTIKPYKQFFPLDGVNVNVNKSEGGRVVITETNKKTTGNYKCEISVEGTFQTVAAEKSMIVMGNNSNASNATNRSMIMLIILLWFLVLISWRHHWHEDIIVDTWHL